MANSIILHHHLGLGDHIVCNGLVRTLANERYEKIFLPCKTRNLGSVRYLYEGFPRVEVFEVKNEPIDILRFSIEKGVKILRIGFENTRKDWDRSFYDIAGVPFSHKWSEFRIPISPTLNLAKEFHNPPTRYQLVSNKCSNQSFGLNINTGIHQIFTDIFTGGENIFSWVSLIEEAEEIHCIDSAFIHLCDQLNTKGNLFFHKIRNTLHMPFVLQKSWKEINYNSGAMP